MCLAPRAVARAQAHSLGPLLVTGHAVLQGRLGGPQSLLEDVRVRGLYPLVVVLFRLHNLEAKLGVELDGTLVVHLDVPAGSGRGKRRLVRSCPTSHGTEP